MTIDKHAGEQVQKEPAPAPAPERADRFGDASPSRISMPIATAVASEAITTDPRAMMPRTTSAMPSNTNQNQLPRRAFSP